MNLSELTKTKTIKKSRRVGRGYGSTKGGHTTGRGTKGQKARKGAKPALGFEGGQVPLYKRLPQMGGFKNPRSKEFVCINVSDLNFFEDGFKVNPKELIKSGIVRKLPKFGVKVLSKGDLNKKIIIEGLQFSKTAREKIEKSGSTINA